MIYPYSILKCWFIRWSRLLFSMEFFKLECQSKFLKNDLIWGRNKTKFTPVHDPACIRFHHIIYPCYFKSKDWFIRWSRLLFWMEFFQPEFCTHLFFGNRDGRYLFCNQTRGHQVISRRILPEFIMNSDQNSSRNAAKFSFLIFDRYVFFLFERIEITKIKISLNTSGPR